MSGMKSKRSKACDISKVVKDAVWERDEQRCIICHSLHAAPNAHYIRRSRGGLGIEQNIVTLCGGCHRQFDSGTAEGQAWMGMQIKAYLKSCYDDWKEEDLIYWRDRQCLTISQ